MVCQTFKAFAVSIRQMALISDAVADSKLTAQLSLKQNSLHTYYLQQTKNQ